MSFSPRALLLSDRRRFGRRLGIDFKVGSSQCGQNLLGYDLLCGKDQGAERDHTLPARHLDPPNAAPDLIGLDKSSTAEHVVEIRVWRQLDLSGHQAVSRLADCHGYHDCRLISDNVNMSTGDVYSQRAVR